MSPAGSLEGARLAVEAGADTLYAGLTNFSMRPKRAEFSPATFAELAEIAHARGRRIHAVLNVYLKPQDWSFYPARVAEAAEAGADAVIVGDLAAIDFIRREFPELPVHVSIQQSVVNPEAVRFFHERGASVVVVSRSLDDIGELERIRREVPEADLEVFIHGGICYMYDGNCYMSSHWRQQWGFDEDLGVPRLLGQNNTKGECQLICKRECSLVSDDRELGRGRMMRRPDQVGLENLPRYLELGVRILKIEGRAMPLYYIEEATRLYRQAIDLYYEDPERYVFRQEWRPAIARLLEARLEYERKWHIR